jgi:phytoene desaturase
MKNKKVAVIGSGFSSLSTACYLAKHGKEVVVFEKNPQIGGRARVWKKNGFTFDMGPSWYWMKEVVDKFFADFDKKTDEYFTLTKLETSFRMIFNLDFNESNFFDVKADINDVYKLFQEEELKYGDKNGALKLSQLLEDGRYTFQKAMDEYLNKKSLSIFEFFDPLFLKSVLKGGILKSYGKTIKKQFKSPKLQDILNFPVLFLGGKSEQIPYLYSLMAYTMIVGGTYYPEGGMFKLVEAMTKLAKSLGVVFVTNAEVKEVEIKNQKIKKIIVLDHNKENVETGFEYAFKAQERKAKEKMQFERVAQSDSKVLNRYGVSITDYTGYSNLTKIYELDFDFVVCGGDYHHFEQNILEAKYRNYSEKFWNKQILAPSALIVYLGLNKKLPNLLHHNLFFDTSLDKHGEEIYDTKSWPENPLFYVCCPSTTDPSVAPENSENLFLLMPLAPDLAENTEKIEKYYEYMIQKIQTFCQTEISKNDIIVKRLYSMENFKSDYFSYKANAYGLANTLGQTAIFKPKLINPKVKNLVYCGQLTVPGPGIPPTIISGKIASSIVLNKHVNNL